MARSEASTIETGSSATIRRGLQQQRARDNDALALAAGQLVREAAERLLRPQADRRQRLVHHAAAPRASTSASLKLPDRHGQHVIDRVERVEDLERVLEDRLHLAPEGRSAPCRSSVRDVLAAVEDLRPSSA